MQERRERRSEAGRSPGQYSGEKGRPGVEVGHEDRRQVRHYDEAPRPARGIAGTELGGLRLEGRLGRVDEGLEALPPGKGGLGRESCGARG